VDRLRSEGKTVLVVTSSTGALGLIAVADQPRAGAKEAVAALRDAGIAHIVMLTGDHADTAAAIGRELGIDEIRASLLPADKVAAVQDLKARYGALAMVGDGVNDAPALVAADVGIAMGVAGTDVAIEAADVALMSDDLARLAVTVRLARRALATIRENVVFSLALKLVFVLAAVPGLITLWLAIFADTGASLIVTLHGMRLLRFRAESEAGHSHPTPGTQD
jgi:Cd2+/Zn2+-exporting ATPase